MTEAGAGEGGSSAESDGAGLPDRVSSLGPGPPVSDGVPHTLLEDQGEVAGEAAEDEVSLPGKGRKGSSLAGRRCPSDGAGSFAGTGAGGARGTGLVPG